MNHPVRYAERELRLNMSRNKRILSPGAWVPDCAMHVAYELLPVRHVASQRKRVSHQGKNASIVVLRDGCWLRIDSMQTTIRTFMWVLARWLDHFVKTQSILLDPCAVFCHGNFAGSSLLLGLGGGMPRGYLSPGRGANRFNLRWIHRVSSGTLHHG